MKRLLWPVCIVLIAIVLFSGFGGTEETVPSVRDPSSVSEAAFAVRTTETEDVTSFLVGKFEGERGIRLCFDGKGTVWETTVNLDTAEGTATLTQSKGASALLQISIGGELRLYTYQLASAEGDFILTDANGVSETYKPIL